MEEQKKPQVEHKGIDADVLEIIKNGIDVACLGSDVEVNRMILNYHAESLKLIEQITDGIGQQNELLTIHFQNEIDDFVRETMANMQKQNKEKKK